MTAHVWDEERTKDRRQNHPVSNSLFRKLKRDFPALILLRITRLLDYMENLWINPRLFVEYAPPLFKIASIASISEKFNLESSRLNFIKLKNEEFHFQLDTMFGLRIVMITFDG